MYFFRVYIIIENKKGDFDMSDDTKFTSFDYFQKLKSSKEIMTEAKLENFYNNCLSMLEKFQITGQLDGMKKVIFLAETVTREKKILDAGITQYVYKNAIDEYIESEDFLYVGKQLCWRHIETFYEAVLNGYGKYAGVKLIVIDSVNNVLSDQNMKNSVADGDFGTKSRERSQFYSKFLPLCKEKGISSFFISQVRQKQNAGMYEDPNRAAVSNVDLHNVDIILKCSATSNQTDASKLEEETIFGKDKVASKCIFKMDSKATDCKNRYIKGNAVELLFEKGKCVWNYYTVKKLLLGNKLLKSPSSGWYTFDTDLCATFGISDNKMRNAEVNKIVQDHVGDFIELLKKMGKYKVGIKETEIPVTEADISSAVPFDEDEGTEE
jgi:hypothetical protein